MVIQKLLKTFNAVVRIADTLILLLYYIIHKWSASPKTLGKVTYRYIVRCP